MKEEVKLRIYKKVSDLVLKLSNNGNDIINTDCDFFPNYALIKMQVNDTNTPYIYTFIDEKCEFIINPTNQFNYIESLGHDYFALYNNSVYSSFLCKIENGSLNFKSKFELSNELNPAIISVLKKDGYFLYVDNGLRYLYSLKEDKALNQIGYDFIGSDIHGLYLLNNYKIINCGLKVFNEVSKNFAYIETYMDLSGKRVLPYIDDFGRVFIKDDSVTETEYLISVSNKVRNDLYAFSYKNKEKASNYKKNIGESLILTLPIK